MKRNRIGILLSAALCSLAAANAQPVLRNAKMRQEAAAPTLSAKLDELNRDAGPLWAGYEVAAVRSPGNHYGGCGIQYLEDGRRAGRENTANQPAPADAYIFLRLANHAISRLEVANQGCPIDAGGMPVVWLTGVKQEESIAVLRGLAGRENPDSALMAIGLHESPAATRVLAEIASSRQNPRLREKASFWLASERGAEGFPALQHLAHDDADAHFRQEITFHLTLVADPRAVEELIRMAKEDADPQVRSQAMFWLAQKAGEKAAGFLASATQNDPEVEVKKKAVFALSQLPKDEGIPQLIHVAETNSDREVRKQAIFWLGQSGDPRALKYLEQVLSR